MTATDIVPSVELQCAIARGWSNDETARRLGCSVAAVEQARAWLDALVAEDPPFVLNTPKGTAPAPHQPVVRDRSKLLAELEQERRIVSGNARYYRQANTPPLLSRRAYHAAYARAVRKPRAA